MAGTLKDGAKDAAKNTANAVASKITETKDKLVESYKDGSLQEAT